MLVEEWMSLLFHSIYALSVIPLLYFWTVVLVKNYYDKYRLFLYILQNIRTHKIVYSFQLLASSVGIVMFTLNINYYFVLALLVIGFQYMTTPIVKCKITRRNMMLLLTEVIISTTAVILAIIHHHIDYLLMSGLLFLISLIVLSSFVLEPLELIIQNHFILAAKRKMSKNPNLVVIGITGSYGKTTFKTFLNELMIDRKVISSPTSVNTLMGLTRFINRSLTPFDDFLILEIGIDRKRGMRKFKRLVKLDYAVITSVGVQHLATFGSVENIYKGKTDIVSLLKKEEKLLYCSDTVTETSRIRDSIPYSSSELKIVNDMVISNLGSFSTRLTNLGILTQAYGALKLANMLGVKMSETNKLMPLLKEPKRRKSIRKVGKTIIIDDSYNINPISASDSIELLKSYSGKKAIVTRGLVELGRRGKEYRYEFGSSLISIQTIYYINNKMDKDTLRGFMDSGGKKENVIYLKRIEELERLLTQYDVILLLPLGDKLTLF